MDDRLELTADERLALRTVLRQEERARDQLETILGRRDALITDLRWGKDGRAPLRPEAILKATVCPLYPDGISRGHFHRIVGRVKDRVGARGARAGRPPRPASD